MKIEFMFPEVCALYGDYGNITLVKQMFKEATIYETKIIDTPRWVSENVDYIYMGAMSEKIQLDVIKILLSHKARFIELIEAGTHIIFTGNAMDVLGKTITDEHGQVFDALGIFDFTTIINKKTRFNCLMLGEYEGARITGFKTQFTMSYGDNINNYFMKVEKGIGLNRESNLEGFKKNNLIATNITGPLLVLNPDFTLNYFKEIDDNVTVPYFDVMKHAQDKRVVDMLQMKTAIY